MAGPSVSRRMHAAPVLTRALQPPHPRLASVLLVLLWPMNEHLLIPRCRCRLRLELDSDVSVQTQLIAVGSGVCTSENFNLSLELK